jgi:hypothetical protein
VRELDLGYRTFWRSPLSALGRARFAAVTDRIQIMGKGAGDSEAAAIVAAVEQFLADTSPPPCDDSPGVSPWAQAALREGIDARQLHGNAWGHAPPPR